MILQNPIESRRGRRLLKQAGQDESVGFPTVEHVGVCVMNHEFLQES